MSAAATDVVILNLPVSQTDKRRDYERLLLREVMERTKAEFGPYQITAGNAHMERPRLLEALKKGELVNLVTNPSNPEWAKALVPVEIPIDLGLQSWRIALIDRTNQAFFKVEPEPRRMRAGAHPEWVSYKALQSNGYQVVAGNSYEGLFDMLMAGRFDYFPRGVNEIFDELETRKLSHPNMVMETSFILHDYIPSLFFVSPRAPRLAQRVKAGMESMLKDGSLERFMLTYFRPNLVKAKFCGRRVFELPNKELPPALLQRKELWFDPFDKRHNLCP